MSKNVILATLVTATIGYLYTYDLMRLTFQLLRAWAATWQTQYSSWLFAIPPWTLHMKFECIHHCRKRLLVLALPAVWQRAIGLRKDTKLRNCLLIPAGQPKWGMSLPRRGMVNRAGRKLRIEYLPSLSLERSDTKFQHPKWSQILRHDFRSMHWSLETSRKLPAMFCATWEKVTRTELKSTSGTWELRFLKENQLKRSHVKTLLKKRNQIAI